MKALLVVVGLIACFYAGYELHDSEMLNDRQEFMAQVQDGWDTMSELAKAECREDLKKACNLNCDDPKNATIKSCKVWKIHK